MTVEIYGAGFSNKGAELMLRTTIARLRAARPDIALGVEPTTDAPYERRAELALRHLVPAVSLYPPRWRRYLHRLPPLRAAVFAATLWPPGADRLCGLTRRDRCHALIDISGYAYGDAFPTVRTRAGAERAASYARRRRPVVLMPQMFGPFKKPAVRDHFKRLADSATLIFAREQPSFDTVRDVIGDDPRLRRCPDITIFSPPPAAAPPTPGRPYACIVPNERMLDQGSKEWGDSYLPRLLAAARRMTERGILPVVVVHSADPGDARLADRLAHELSGACETFRHPDPFALKSFIAGARFLVGSRFHSIVAALSSGVPAVALGWAHKYEALAADFAVPELQHRGSDPADHLVSLVDTLCDHDRRERLASTILASKERMRPDVEAAWADVLTLLPTTEPA